MKILIISHNPITTYHNMGKIMLSFFSEFKKEELCQLYIYPTLPDIDVCQSYYRITDKDILKSYYKFKVKGKIIKEEEISSLNKKMFENDGDVKIYRNIKNKKALRQLLRDIMWKFSKWFNEDVKQWINNQHPTHIFVAPGSSKFIYDIALKCSKYFNIPIITCICDDYYFVKPKKFFLQRIQQKLLCNKIEKLINESSYIITVSEELNYNFFNHFHKNVKTLMTTSNYPIINKSKFKEHPKTITYFGNIRCNRYYSLIQIGQVLDEINLEYSTNYKLLIYSSEKDKSILKRFENVNSINFKGFISGKEFDKAFFNSDILLHTEAFDEISIDRVKHSISTKIADSLNSGICLFAYGPPNVASMKYLIENNAAVCAINYNELKNKLLDVFNNSALRKEKILNGMLLVKKNHDKKKSSQELYNIFLKIHL